MRHNDKSFNIDFYFTIPGEVNNPFDTDFYYENIKNLFNTLGNIELTDSSDPDSNAYFFLDFFRETDTFEKYIKKSSSIPKVDRRSRKFNVFQKNSFIFKTDLKPIYFCHPHQELYILLFCLNLDQFDLDKFLSKKRFRNLKIRLKKRYGTDYISKFLESHERMMSNIVKQNSTTTVKLSKFDEYTIRTEAFHRIIKNHIGITCPYFINSVQMRDGKLKINCDVSFEQSISNTVKSIKGVFYQIFYSQFLKKSKFTKDEISNYGFSPNEFYDIKGANSLFGINYDYVINPCTSTEDVQDSIISMPKAS